jgi:hypothetical protein
MHLKKGYNREAICDSACIQPKNLPSKRPKIRLLNFIVVKK